MTIKRNWHLAKVIQCNECGYKTALWRAVLPGSGWRARPLRRSMPKHECPVCVSDGTFISMSSGR